MDWQAFESANTQAGNHQRQPEVLLGFEENNPAIANVYDFIDNSQELGFATQENNPYPSVGYMDPVEEYPAPLSMAILPQTGPGLLSEAFYINLVVVLRVALLPDWRFPNEANPMTHGYANSDHSLTIEYLQAMSQDWSCPINQAISSFDISAAIWSEVEKLHVQYQNVPLVNLSAAIADAISTIFMDAFDLQSWITSKQLKAELQLKVYPQFLSELLATIFCGITGDEEVAGGPFAHPTDVRRRAKLVLKRVLRSTQQDAEESSKDSYHLFLDKQSWDIVEWWELSDPNVIVIEQN
ncbi:hypothetical protein JVT61DRAFT_10544 [Boletus reticuloceps]|uniref:Uncharacterized protein n=1 Tax=Boletus reticuloceps TaxID=495285 RepID=A0A8I2Z0E1_9AGAM|nr:hypothetical protein JVT61DRAFT_10544 [Boletus reticuloceps]